MRPLILCGFLAFVVALIGPVSAGKTYIHTEVRARIELMQSNKAALATLTDMMAGQRRFSPAEARTARRKIIRNLRAIPRAFRSHRVEPNSNARELIWLNKRDFNDRAKTAARAAASLKTNDLAKLRKTLPELIETCTTCHKAYRSTPREFTTH